MISDASRYYGCVIACLIEQSNKAMIIERLYKDMPGFYLLDESLPLYIKYSTSRKGPWGFNFHLYHQEQQKNLFKEYKECITAFVCGRDGIVALPYVELHKILNTESKIQENISIRRRYNHMYQVKGRNGILDRKVSRNSLFEILNKYNDKLVHQ